MRRDDNSQDRRSFIKVTAAASAGMALGARVFAGPADSEPKAPPAKEKPKTEGESKTRSKAVLVRDKAVVGAKGEIDAKIVERMLDDSVKTLTGAEKASEGWCQLFGPKDIVGIKTNVWKFLATPPEVESAIKARLVACGVPEASIKITDRAARTELAACTALLNVRPVRTHHWSGIGGCIKNYIMFVEEPANYHDDSCADLGAIWNLPIVKGKTRLNLLLALTPQFYGRGPHSYDPRHVWTYGGIFASKDPVAVDSLGAELLRLKRIEFFGEDKPVTATKHVGFAETRHGIGVADLKRIDLVKLGWQENLLLG